MAKKTSPPHIDTSSKPTLAAWAQAASKAAAAVGITIDWQAVLAVIVSVMKLLGACGLMASQASRVMNAPTQLHKFILRRECRKQFRGHPDKADACYAALVDQGKTVTEAAAGEMFAESGVAVAHRDGAEPETVGHG